MACNLISNIGVNMHRISLFCLNTLQPRQNGRHFADAIFKRIFVSDNVWIPIKISLKFVPKGPINNIPALVQIMTWRRPGDKPLYEPMMISLPTHICVTRPQCVKQSGLVPTKAVCNTYLHSSWCHLVITNYMHWYITFLKTWKVSFIPL